MVDLFADDAQDLPLFPERPEEPSVDTTSKGGDGLAASCDLDAFSKDGIKVPGLAMPAISRRVRGDSLAYAEVLLRNRCVSDVRLDAGDVVARVQGTAPGVFYDVRAPQAAAAAGEPTSQCTCPDFAKRGGVCKHGAALLLAVMPGSAYAARNSSTLCEVASAHPIDSALVSNQGALPFPAETLMRLDETSRSELVINEPGPASSRASRIPGRRRLPASFFPTIAPSQAPRQTRVRPMVPDLSDAPIDETIVSPQQPPAKRPRNSIRGTPASVGDKGYAPAKPTSAYQFFLRNSACGRGNGGMPAAAARWRDLSDAERRPFEDAAAEDRSRYEAERREHLASIVSKPAIHSDPRFVLNAVSGVQERTFVGNPLALGQGADTRCDEPAGMLAIVAGHDQQYAAAANLRTSKPTDSLQPPLQKYSSPRGLGAQLDLLMFPEDSQDTGAGRIDDPPVLRPPLLQQASVAPHVRADGVSGSYFASAPISIARSSDAPINASAQAIPAIRPNMQFSTFAPARAAEYSADVELALAVAASLPQQLPTLPSPPSAQSSPHIPFPSAPPPLQPSESLPENQLDANKADAIAILDILQERPNLSATKQAVVGQARPRPAVSFFDRLAELD